MVEYNITYVKRAYLAQLFNTSLVPRLHAERVKVRELKLGSETTQDGREPGRFHHVRDVKGRKDGRKAELDVGRVVVTLLCTHAHSQE